MVPIIKARVARVGRGGKVAGRAKARARGRGVWRRMVGNLRVNWAP